MFQRVIAGPLSLPPGSDAGSDDSYGDSHRPHSSTGSETGSFMPENSGQPADHSYAPTPQRDDGFAPHAGFPDGLYQPGVLAVPRTHSLADSDHTLVNLGYRIAGSLRSGHQHRRSFSSKSESDTGENNVYFQEGEVYRANPSHGQPHPSGSDGNVGTGTKSGYPTQGPSVYLPTGPLRNENLYEHSLKGEGFYGANVLHYPSRPSSDFSIPHDDEWSIQKPLRQGIPTTKYDGWANSITSDIRSENSAQNLEAALSWVEREMKAALPAKASTILAAFGVLQSLLGNPRNSQADSADAPVSDATPWQGRGQHFASKGGDTGYQGDHREPSVKVEKHTAPGHGDMMARGRPPIRRSR